MPLGNLRLTPREQKLMEALFDLAADMTADALLDICADQETRICLLELGI